MKGLKSANTLAEEQAAGILPSGRYGDTLAGATFSDEQSTVLCRLSLSMRGLMSSWDKAWVNGVCFTFIDCDPPGQEERDLFEAARAEGERLWEWTMINPRLEAARICNRLIEFDGSDADDILSAVVEYLTASDKHKEVRESYASTVELVWQDPDREPGEDLDAWSGGFADNH